MAQSIVRRLTAPLLKVGDLAFDAEVRVSRGGKRTFTQNRTGAGAILSDHSYSEPREFTIEGGVSGLAQPQNLGRPGNDNRGTLTDLGLGAAEGVTGYNFSTRVQDFEQRLNAVLNRGDVLEVISKVLGRVRCVLLEWQAEPTEGGVDYSMIQLRLLEVSRAGLTIAAGTPEALALNGSGGAVTPGGGGPSNATTMTLDVVP